MRMDTTDNAPERHPLEPFLPEGAKVLMLGSFPPKRERWSMDFFYPNFNNDMWRILGLVFLGDKDFVTDSTGRRFDAGKARRLCTAAGIALFDTASEVIRLRDNASDKFLQITGATDIASLLRSLPQCGHIIVTGEKAAQTVAGLYGCEVPPTCSCVPVTIGGRTLVLHRLPSSSRAYPMKLEDKAACYRRLLRDELGLDAGDLAREI